MENKKMLKDFDEGVFATIVLGVVFDTKTKKILIIKRKKDEYIPELTWAFPGGRPKYGEELEEGLKRKIKEKIGLDVESLGPVFAKVYPEREELLAIYYLCEVVGGEEKLGEDIEEFKWIEPNEIENHFTTSFHPKLKEYIRGLKN